MSISVRPLTQSDQPALREMLYHAIHSSKGQTPPPHEIIDQPELSRYFTNWGRPGDSGFAAVDDSTGQIVGAVWLRLWSGDDHGYGYVNPETPELTIALLPDYRGFGLGSQLMTAILKYSESRHPAISLSVSPDNPAKRLYERLGFTTVGNDGSSLTMLKQLTPPD